MLFDPLTSEEAFTCFRNWSRKPLSAFWVNPENLRHHSSGTGRDGSAPGRTALKISDDVGAAEIEQAFASAHDKKLGAVLLGDHPFFFSNSGQPVKAAVRYRKSTDNVLCPGLPRLSLPLELRTNL